ncbi:MAG: hypothetical protein DYG94_10630 [Leptolyngbya sp. PLA3]|nr:MAG: hypothetical protein EDM82_09195 [Cyanobacteria bacterium CYA]MCE7969187.1 hypothetical protein [Leptolyngbya sp. PL-A3]
MRLVRYAVLLSTSLVLGGCGAHRQSHVHTYSVQDRDWWYPGVNQPIVLAASDDLGAATYSHRSLGYLAVSDGLGAACFDDTRAYSLRMREPTQTRLVTVPNPD